MHSGALVVALQLGGTLVQDPQWWHGIERAERIAHCGIDRCHDPALPLAHELRAEPLPLATGQVCTIDSRGDDRPGTILAAACCATCQCRGEVNVCCLGTVEQHTRCVIRIGTRIHSAGGIEREHTGTPSGTRRTAAGIGTLGIVGVKLLIGEALELGARVFEIPWIHFGPPCCRPPEYTTQAGWRRRIRRAGHRRRTAPAAMGADVIARDARPVDGTGLRRSRATQR